MCGIVGYIGQKKASDLIVSGLKRLEYRGYDSAGVCIIDPSGITINKQAGKVADLESNSNVLELEGSLGVGHTRWATHGVPNDTNAHPHTDMDSGIALVHNGIIENYLTIKKKLEKAGYTFKSDTDSEVLAVFIGMLYKTFNDIEKAVQVALQEVDGTFGIVVISKHDP